ncbi:MAG: NhaC family Na+:H+ antiporter, partial [Glaciecola sp.]
GAFVIAALGLGIADGNVENLLYIPLAFACWTAPLIGIFYAYTGLFSPKATDQEKEHWESSGEAIAEFNSDGTPKVEEEDKDNDTEKEGVDNDLDKSGQ